MAGNLIDDEQFTYYYDALNRLESVVSPGETEILRIEYDAFGWVVMRKHRRPGCHRPRR